MNAEKKLTKWEAGNELVYAADAIGEVILELKDYPEIANRLKKVRSEISDIYNENGFVKEMGFGI